MNLTREQILNKVDIEIKEIPVPEWGGNIFIRQLSRGEQDTYLKRQYGDTRLKQDSKARNQEISAVNIYGHDAYLCVCGICNEDGTPVFKHTDVEDLKKKNGMVIGRIAVEIVKFSGMAGDIPVEDEVKNS